MTATTQAGVATTKAQEAAGYAAAAETSALNTQTALIQVVKDVVRLEAIIADIHGFN